MNILITGAGSGIGKAAALRLARRAHICVADINGEAARSTANEIRAAGGNASPFQCDVTQGAAVKDLVEKSEAIAPLDGLFNNAGISIRNRVENIAAAEWDLMLNTHARGMFLVAQNTLRKMVARKRGVIVQTSSDFAVIGVPVMAAYCAAKTAIYSLTKALAVEFGPHGIRVNAIGPGPIDTPILKQNRSDEEYRQTVTLNETRSPMGRLGRPEEVAVVVDFLLSDRSAYINGQLVQPNGGSVIW